MKSSYHCKRKDRCEKENKRELKINCKKKKANMRKDNLKPIKLLMI